MKHVVRTALVAAASIAFASAAQAQVLPCGRKARWRSASTRRARRSAASRPVYTPDGAAKVAGNPLYDYVFLNLEGAYDAAAVKAYGTGLKKASQKTLIVRIPPISKDGADVTRARVKEIFDAGADGVTIPHIRDIEEAKLALSFFAGMKADIWSPANPKGTKIAMLMLEDPKAIDAARRDCEPARDQRARVRHRFSWRKPSAAIVMLRGQARKLARSRCWLKPSGSRSPTC